MSLSPFSERRDHLRAVLARDEITSPGSVFDGATARLASAAGYEYGLLGGSIASHVVLAAPDVTLITLSELAAQAERVCRASSLPLIVDADHGYGNALNVRRTIEELEAAGVAAATIEDTLLPRAYGNKRSQLISREEFRDKLRAAVDARQDKSFVIIARSDCLSLGIEETAARSRSAIEAGVDAICLTGKATAELLNAAHGEAALPLIINDPTPRPQAELLGLGVRVLYQGHEPYFVGLQAIYDAYLSQRAGRTEELRAKVISPELKRIAMNQSDYDHWSTEFLG